MKNKLLFIGGTHGDEQLGVEVLQKLSTQRSDFDWIIGNEEAFRRGQRYFEYDLNRSGEGDATSAMYEKRRAFKIQNIAKKYDYVIDIHGAKNDCGIFTIVTNPSKQNLALASMLDIQNIVIWPSITPEMQYPMSEFFPCGLEIECGNKYSSETKKQLYTIVERATNQLQTMYPKNISRDELLSQLQEKNIYRMYDNLKKNDLPDTISLSEFVEVTIKNETFTPVFISTYDYSDIAAYKLEKISIEKLTNTYFRA